MTSSNLQRWISPFPRNLNMKGDCETYQGSWSAGVEYYSMCISLASGSLNDTLGDIKSDAGLRALIWIAKTTSAVNGMQQRGMYTTRPTDCKCDQWIFDQRKKRRRPMRDFQLKSALSSEARRKWRNNICMWHKHVHNERIVWKCIMYMLYV